MGGFLLLVAIGVSWHLHRKAKAQAKLDNDWIAPVKQLVFRRKKLTAEGVVIPHDLSPSESKADSKFVIFSFLTQFR